jgi:hypothetical protein
VRKTTVYLRLAQSERLAWLAASEDTSPAEILRRALAAYQPSRAGDRDFRLAGAFEGPGDSIAGRSKAESLRSFGD